MTPFSRPSTNQRPLTEIATFNIPSYFCTRIVPIFPKLKKITKKLRYTRNKKKFNKAKKAYT